MSRFARRTDLNHAELVREMREAGLCVIDLSRVGNGVPDLLVSNSDEMWLVEVKSPKGKMHERQRQWHDDWRGKKPLIIRQLQEFLEATRKK